MADERKPGYLESLLIAQNLGRNPLQIDPNASGFLAGGPGAAYNAAMKMLPSSNSLAIPPAPSVAEMKKFSRVEAVPLSQARGTQPKMGWDAFNAANYAQPYIKGYGDKPVAVKREDGEYLIFDGHHRVVSALNQGGKTMDMYVIDAKHYAPEFQGRKPAPDKMSIDDLLNALLKD